MRALALRLLAAACLLIPAAAGACAAGTYYEKPVGPFKAEVSYGAYRLQPGEAVPFHVELINVSSDSYGPGNPVSFDKVTATLREGPRTVAAGSATRTDFSETALTLVLPKKHADYALEVTYSKNDAVLATAAFPVRAGRGDWRSMFNGRRSALLAGVTVRTQ